jgi:arsenate reductase-like glutaredoxin family protein
MSNITIYHNPACGTSRNTLEMIRNSGNEPTVIHYLEIHLHAMSWSNSLQIWAFQSGLCCAKTSSLMKNWAC